MATLGIILQMCGYFQVFFQPPSQPFLPPVAALSGIAGIAVSVVTVAIAAGSGWLIATAVRTLGKQWALRARLVEDHKLITVGLYADVRNPIYTGMLGMLVATGLATDHGIALPIAVVIFAVGMVIRARSEEKLLWAVFWGGVRRLCPASARGAAGNLLSGATNACTDPVRRIS